MDAAERIAIALERLVFLHEDQLAKSAASAQKANEAFEQMMQYIKTTDERARLQGSRVEFSPAN